MAAKRAIFQINWLQEPQFRSWLEQVDDKTVAKCKSCNKTFSLSNMGRRAVSSHMNSAKHMKISKAASSNMSMQIFTNRSTPKSSVQTDRSDNPINQSPNNTIASSSDQSCSSMYQKSQNILISNVLSSELSSQPSQPRGLKSMLVNDDVTKAEVLWCLQTVVTHKSLRSAGKDINLMARMFPDSDIVKKMKLQKDKIGYTLAFGIGPFVYKNLITTLSYSDFITIGFDESLNKVSQKNQMDVNVRYWDKEDEEVKCRYLTSVFLGRSTAEDLLKAYSKAIQPLDKDKTLQISMDGPNVNKKFLRDLKDSMHQQEPEAKTLIDIGSCGLHTMHCAFKGAMIATGWNLVSFLRCLYNLLKDCPARRAIYTATTSSTLFPLKFCAVRWLDNANVAERALQMLPYIKLFVKEMKKTKEVSSHSFDAVVMFVEDTLLPAKLEFFKSLASDLEPFLREFQGDQPLSPFLFDKLNIIIRTEMEKVVLADAMKQKTIKNIELNEENLRPAKHITLGIGVKSALRSIEKQPDLKILNFKKECKTGLIRFIEKMLEKSPLKYNLTRSLSCLSPKVAVEIGTSHVRMENLLTALLDARWINSVEADQAQRLFQNITQDEDVIHEFKNYKTMDRLDSFWKRILKNRGESCSSLAKIIKLCCTLSHGNASIERGFSVNKECISENMQEELLIAQRTIFEYVVSSGGMEKVEITKPLIHSARNSYQLYKEHLSKKKTEENDVNLSNFKKRASEKELKDLELKRAKVLEEAQQKAELMAEKIEKLKKLA